MTQQVVYQRIEPGASPSEIAVPPPFRVVIVADAEGTAEWQMQISEWLAQSGCLYMMAWGINCSSWDDSVDIANIKAFEHGEIPEDSFIMTTWHEDEPMQEAFWFAKNCAIHSTVKLENTVILHISTQSRERELLDAYAGA
jgi:hypothetical protein